MIYLKSSILHRCSASSAWVGVVMQDCSVQFTKSLEPVPSEVGTELCCGIRGAFKKRV